MFQLDPESRIPHIQLADSADVVVIAPATATTIARLACGMADELLSCTVLASRAPVVVAPAMDMNMYENAATQENIAALRKRGFTFVAPESGKLASGKEGPGRLADNDRIAQTICQVLGSSGDLAGRRLVVTAGGTQEPIDPVRHIGNRSSGKMGYAIAEAARDRGAEVVLVSAPTSLQPPAGVEIVGVRSAEDMYRATHDAARGCDALIMAAAVADYRPKSASAQKIKKGAATLLLELEQTPDILGSIQGHLVRVGFAAESGDLIENARDKLNRKGLDLIVANDITATDSGFGSEYNRVAIVDRVGNVDTLPLLPKREIADKVLDRVARLLG
jgi:phosphopantothenoylcysteine decarboxylase/phosphopantothenate--cysteine ligase